MEAISPKYEPGPTLKTGLVNYPLNPGYSFRSFPPNTNLKNLGYSC
jgi:hypothetical protein